ncbi:MAG: glycoside hydrolase family 140 protein [bacterium]|nr:MAG: glycoside hydrolase family 140 protein [bacterium]
MPKKNFCYFLILLFILTIVNITFAKSLKVSKNGRFLVYEDDTPFFYLGDTAWELFHCLDHAEADKYLSNRAEKGFNVIQAVILSDIDGLNTPNAYGDLPLKNKNPSQLNEAYFKHVDYIVNKAEKLGLFIGMLPTWGGYWCSSNPDRVIFTPENAKAYGKFLCKRYVDKQIIWILGGDRDIKNESERKIMEAMAYGLKEGDGGAHLITYHPKGPGLSSDYFHQAEWLDFNMFQSFHGAHDHDNGLFAEHDYALTPAKPTIDGEQRYETIPTGFYFKGFNKLDRIDNYDCRQAAFWSLLAGACGHTYGDNNIWQMWEPKKEPILSAAVPWYDALDHPGAFQMGLVRKLFESRPFQKLVPNQSIIKNGPLTGGAKIRAAVANDGSFAFVYSPRGEKFTIDKGMINATRTNEIWFDPRYGIAYNVHSPNTKGMQTFTPPTSGRGNDWILIVEDADLEFPLPNTEK